MAFKAEQRKVKEFLTGKILEIPRNQRRYVWKEVQWKELLDDLLFTISTNRKRTHFIGSIVLKDEEAINGINHFTLIDGQQRAFTIVLFLTAIMQLFKERNMEDDFKGTSKLLIITDLKNQSCCVLNSDFYLDLKAIVTNICDWDNINAYKEQLKKYLKIKQIERPIIQCVDYYYKRLKDFSDEKIIAIRDALIDMNFVEIIAPTDEDCYTIFEILNARGQALEDHELLKNYIMRYILPQEQTKVDEVKVKWTEYIDKGLGSNVKKFFKHYTTHKYATSSKESIYKIIQRGTPDKDVNTLFEDILLKVEYYIDILSPNKDDDERNISNTEYQVFSFFKQKKSEQFRPIILSLKHQKEEEKISKTRYDAILRYLQMFFICYNIIGEEKSNKLEDPIYKFAPILENNYSDKSLEEFVYSLTKRLPSKEVFSNAFQNVGWSNHTDFYKDASHKDRVKIIIELLEQLTSNIGLTDYTLEHILPDSECAENAQIGNILPLEDKLNSRCKNKSLVEKIPIYKESLFSITRQFAERYENNENSFSPQKRAQYMSKQIYEAIISAKI